MILTDRTWKLKYTPDDGDLVSLFYVPALETAVRYDRSTGFFSASALTLAARGIEGLVRNNGRMRLVVGCTLAQAEIDAIEKGLKLRDAVEQKIGASPLDPSNKEASQALELLSWMIAKGFLEVRVAVPCDLNRTPIPSDGIFHEKAGIVEDKAGYRLAWNGSLNETAAGWQHNWESINIFTSWGNEPRRVDEEETNFSRIWVDKAQRVITLEVPAALRADLMRFLPSDDRPARMRELPLEPAAPIQSPDEQQHQRLTVSELRRLIWGFIKYAPTLPNGGERVGEATAAVTPWPHQIRAFQRMYDNWPPKLLIADEVGLGKTIEAGLLLRQAWLAGRAKRILILAPKAVLRQWQIELREKFNLNWPIYDGKRLVWYPSPAMRGRDWQLADSDKWHAQPFVIASSQLMRREGRADQLLKAEPWDIVVLDEAHHARRRSGGAGPDVRPNKLLRLMRSIKDRTQGLLLLTATPMQVDPIEVWDLLSLLGLPSAWNEDAFQKFFNLVEQPNPSPEAVDDLARLFQAAEQKYGSISTEEAVRFCSGSRLRANRILRALRDVADVPRRQFENADRKAAIALVRANTPVRRLVSRHTREVLRKYYRAGKITTPIADRQVRDEFIRMTPLERELYEQVEDYISNTYHRAGEKERTAVGFVMTIYRRRLASSFWALEETLKGHLEAIRDGNDERIGKGLEDDVFDSEVDDELLDTDEAAALEHEALTFEQRSAVEDLIRQIQELPPDSKLERLRTALEELSSSGYQRAMVFTQYTDTMDFLREQLSQNSGAHRLMCYSGRGGEIRSADGTWRAISRDDAKRRFREGQADVLLCTDAAAEGLNFQFCGALVNYDMPWNPMRVEQRIGRIDRLGQENAVIRIVNLHYDDTVETDVYRALRSRIGLFESVVGKLQPILSQLPKRISTTVLTNTGRESIVNDIESALDEAGTGLDLDAATDADLELPPRQQALYNLDDLDRIVNSESARPAGIHVSGMAQREYSYLAPGMSQPVRITTESEFFQEHAESVELWSPGSPLFPVPEVVATLEDLPHLSSVDLLLDSVFDGGKEDIRRYSGLEALVQRADGYLHKSFGLDHRWSEINRAIWGAIEARADRSLRLSDVDAIAAGIEMDSKEILAALAILSAPASTLLRMNYSSQSNPNREIPETEVIDRLRAWWREKSMNNEEWKRWASEIVIKWTPASPAEPRG
jgi:SNF2 family DNA or RNA helicase